MAAANDGGKWVFYASGTPQPFEEPERYKERRIRARFTDEMLERYCAALGISLFDEHFYGPSGFLVTVPLPSGHNTMSLEEARELLGLAPQA
jgi:hypothetical protein